MSRAHPSPTIHSREYISDHGHTTKQTFGLPIFFFSFYLKTYWHCLRARRTGATGRLTELTSQRRLVPFCFFFAWIWFLENLSPPLLLLLFPFPLSSRLHQRISPTCSISIPLIPWFISMFNVDSLPYEKVFFFSSWRIFLYK